mmetsp:Transcript_263/g.500  ORF Transcript_263/g.500 Transcript_263/m.500 type:complete len:277 (-) Transcript_263:126-956(-)
MGFVGAAFGLAFTFGPALGGVLSVQGYRLPALIATAVTVFDIGVVVAFLKESRVVGDQSRSKSSKPVQQTPWKSIVFKSTKMIVLLLIRFLFGIAFYMFRSAFPLFTRDRLGLSAKQTGYTLSYLGLLVAGVQGRGVAKLSKRYKESTLVTTSAAIFGMSLWLWSQSFTVPILLVTLVPLAASNGIMLACTSSMFTQSVSQDDVGSAMGLVSAVDSICKVLSPTIVGYLHQRMGPHSPGQIGAGVMAIVFWLCYRLAGPMFKRPSQSSRPDAGKIS